MNKDNVTAAKPKVGGAVHTAPIGTTLPTDAITALSAAFASLGYISEDGLKNSRELERDAIKAWGGDTVLVTHNGMAQTFTFTLIEAMRIEVLKFIHNAGNVSGIALSSGIGVTVKNEDSEEQVLAVDMILRGGVKKRIVVPRAHITEIGEITYADSAAVGYEVTVECVADDDGVYSHEYLQTPAASGSGGSGGTT